MEYFISESEWNELEKEQQKLESLINNLMKYLQSNPQRIIGEFQTNLLISQLNYMCSYNNILCVRLNSLSVQK